VNVLFGELFPEGERPARTIYQAAALPFGAKVKVMGMAQKD
jgi:2-iminobutanoate/2-iminopropanoate deaminase